MKSLSNKIKTIITLFVFTLVSMGMLQTDTATWVIDKAHSAINFQVTHFFTPVNGSFEDYEATINFNPDNLQQSKIDVKIDVSSIETKNDKRDNHLQSPDFFNAEKWPHITFTSTDIESKGNNEFVAHGTLTIRDISKKIDLPFTLLGIKDNPMKEGKKVAGVTSTLTVKRSDFNVGTGDWASDAVVGDEVKIDITVEMNADNLPS